MTIYSYNYQTGIGAKETESGHVPNYSMFGNMLNVIFLFSVFMLS